MPNHKQCGFTLPELMIGALIGLFLLGGVIQVFTANKQSNRLIETSSRQQESIRFAFQHMRRNLESAGFVGQQSTRLPPIVVLATTPPQIIMDASTTFNQTDTLHGVKFGSAQPPENERPYSVPNAAFTTSKYVPIGSDGFAFYRVIPGEGVCLNRNVIDTGATVIDVSIAEPNDYGTANHYTQVKAHASEAELAQFCNIDPDKPRYILVNSGSNAFVFRGLNYGGSGFGLAGENDLNRLPFDIPASKNQESLVEVYDLTGSMYYVACETAGGPDCSLYYDHDIDDGGKPEPFVPGVVDMRIRYGVDTDTDGVPNQYFEGDASELTVLGRSEDFRNVVALEIALLLVSDKDNVVDAPLSYVFPPWATTGATTAADRRIRKVYTTTIVLPNRVDRLSQ